MSRAPRRWLLGLAVALLLAVLWAQAWSALRIARADFAAMPARQQLSVWRTGKPFTLQAWQRARAGLLEARGIAPADADLAEDLALLHKLRAYQVAATPALAQWQWEQALHHYRDAARLRAIAPNAWANIALAQHQLITLAERGQIFLPPDVQARARTELAQATDLARRQGPWEPAVRRILTQLP